MKLVNFLAPPEDYTRWKFAARDWGMSFSAWCRFILNDAARLVVVVEEDPGAEGGWEGAERGVDSSEVGPCDQVIPAGVYCIRCKGVH